MTSGQIGRLVGDRYRLVSRLATGGMGVTYRAWDLRRGSPVVLKMPRRPRDDPDGEEFTRISARFIREIEAMRALAHDYIVPIVGHGDDQGVPFVAMRFLPGGALAEDRKPAAGGDWQPVPAGRLHFWLPSVATALDFIHARGMVHRDVKPANIYFDGFRNTFLGDFGIAKVVDDEAGLEKGQTLTATHLSIGTPEYMAPELLSRRATPDGRADQYALAVSVYELLSGRRPFTGSTAHIVVEHAMVRPPTLDAESLALPRGLVAAVDRALAKKPGDRFGSCREFAEAVLASVTPEPNDPQNVRLLCPGCRKVLRVPAAAGGRRGSCPSCQEVLEIAEDFSALWLESEAALVTEPLPESKVGSALGTVGEVSDDAPSTAQPVFASVGRSWSQAAMLTSAIVSAAIAACAGGFCVHCLWSGHHERIVQAAASQRDHQRTAHANALEAAHREQMAALQATEEEWKRKLEDEQKTWEEALASADQARIDSERKLSEANQARLAREQELAKAEREQQTQAEEARTSADRVAAEHTAAKGESGRRKPFQKITNSIGIEMVLIPPGKFVMGDEQYGPAHEVRLTAPFYIGVFEVTNAQWKAVMGEGPKSWKHELLSGLDVDMINHGDDHPVEGVSWEDVMEFCGKLAAMGAEKDARRVYRLPTEAEWEYACRAGTTTAYSFGNDQRLLDAYGWYNSRDGGFLRASQPVGRKKPNSWGLYDVHGNVWEWCSDWYGDYANKVVTNPRGPPTGPGRVLRGGGWFFAARGYRSAVRIWHAPTDRIRNLGFRLAMSAADEELPDAGGN